MKPKTKEIAAFKVVQYNYPVYGSGTLKAAFKTEADAKEYKEKLIDIHKFDFPISIFDVEPVYQYFNFIDFLQHS